MTKEVSKNHRSETVGRRMALNGLPSREDTAGLPPQADLHPLSDTVDRRTIMKLMGASAVLAAGLPGCRRKPYRKIVSMADTPEYQHPGKPLYYASTWTEGRTPYGMMIKTLEGRPVKIEGLPGHPLNRGTSNAQIQGSILSLYDPDRLKAPMRGEKTITWEEADQEIMAALKSAGKTVFITRSSLGPAERALIKEFLSASPGARHLVHESFHDGPRRTAWQAIYGEAGTVQTNFAEAKVILSIDSDFLGTDGDVLKTVASFSKSRVVKTGRIDAITEPVSSRLYVAEGAMTVTGSNADHRIVIRPSFALRLVRALGSAIRGETGPLKQAAGKHGWDDKVLLALVQDLKANPGASLVVAGPHLPVAVHAAVCLLNQALGADGKTLSWNPDPHALPVDPPGTIHTALKDGVDLLLLFGVNPVYDWPAGGFDTLIQKAGLSVGHGLYHDETLNACTLALPSTHNLESWNDAHPLPGVHGICQPVIAPLFDARQEAESLLNWLRALKPRTGRPEEPDDWHDRLKKHWQTELLSNADDLEKAWDDALREGIFGQPVTVPLPEPDRKKANALSSMNPPECGDRELVILPHHAVLDGRFANNGWLLEFPDPISKLVWDNAAVIAPETAETLNLSEGDVVEVCTGMHSLVLPVLVQPGTAGGVIVTTLGHGRTRAGRVGNQKGVNCSPILGSGPFAVSPWVMGNAQLKALGKKQTLVRVQKYFSMEDRPIVLHGTAGEFKRNPHFVDLRRHLSEDSQLHDAYDYSKGPKWAMAIDLNTCTGCGVCTIACQAENNIPVVGKKECGMGREMHWIRLDRYHGGDPANPLVYNQPMLCQHCDNAPCESVCPVNATAHSHEGLNEQVYNRCVGTRYCANNCPYKVRRFNFFHYTKENLVDPVQELAYNPQVTVRSRGVMEKCTFCLQRINEQKFKYKNKGEPIPDGAIRPACVQACPAGAMVFGNLNDPNSRITKMKNSPLAYFVLEELNVRPNVSYLAKVRNPHPSLDHLEGKGGHG
ncbi:MAG: 4Fe-4S dicluster domain-containing protein [Planctomycetes bacterium]|nr:4Fe-4S dicluster domain-containing protein [Planctomycetota bacterium]